MKVLLTTLNSKYIHSSLSIRYLNSYCNDLNLDIDVREYTINQNTEYITGEIFKTKADVVAFSCYIWNIEETIEICNRLKLINKDIKIILGGPEVSFDGEIVLKKYDFIDFVIFGEGEETFKELLINLNENNYDYSKIKGLMYRNDEGICKNVSRPLILNLDDIPSPYNGNFSDLKNKIVYFESSRGCPFNCKFCLSSSISGVRFFSIERVKEELRNLIKAGVKQVKFVDRTFNAKKEYALEIMNFIIDEMKNSQYKINFHFEVTAHLLSEDVLEFLKDVPKGLFQFEIGVQSTNDKTIESIDRTTNFSRLKEVVEKVKSYGNIHQHLDLIVGLPYEDYETFKKSFNDVYNIRPEKIQMGFLKLLKGSSLRQDSKKHGFVFLDKPPYEVLENKYIKYDEVLKLKLIEDLVEKYGNEGNFENSINFIIKHLYSSPFDFYEDFSIYWENKKHHTLSHSKNGLYRIIYDYYNEKFNKYNDIFKELLKFDMLYNNKNISIPSYLGDPHDDDVKNKKYNFLKDENLIEKYLSFYKGLSSRKITNEVNFEEFKYNITDFIKSNYNLEEITYEKNYILFTYHDLKATNVTEEIAEGS